MLRNQVYDKLQVSAYVVTKYQFTQTTILDFEIEKLYENYDDNDFNVNMYNFKRCYNRISYVEADVAFTDNLRHFSIYTGFGIKKVSPILIVDSEKGNNEAISSLDDMDRIQFYGVRNLPVKCIRENKDTLLSREQLAVIKQIEQLYAEALMCESYSAKTSFLKYFAILKIIATKLIQDDKAKIIKLSKNKDEILLLKHIYRSDVKKSNGLLLMVAQLFSEHSNSSWINKALEIQRMGYPVINADEETTYLRVKETAFLAYKKYYEALFEANKYCTTPRS